MLAIIKKSNSRRHWLHHRVRGPCSNRALRGRPLTVCNMAIEAVPVRRPGGRGRQTIPARQGPPPLATDRRWGGAPSPTGSTLHWTMAPTSTLWWNWRFAQIPPQVTWGNFARNGAGRVDATSVPDPDKEKGPQQALRQRSAPSPTWGWFGKPLNLFHRGQGVHRFLQPTAVSRGHARGRSRGEASGPEGQEHRFPRSAVPGSGLVKAQAEAEGLHEIFQSGRRF